MKNKNKLEIKIDGMGNDGPFYGLYLNGVVIKGAKHKSSLRRWWKNIRKEFPDVP